MCEKCGIPFGYCKGSNINDTADVSESAVANGYMPRYSKQGRYLDEQDTLRVIILAIKHVDRLHNDWEELIGYVDRFDASKKCT